MKAEAGLSVTDQLEVRRFSPYGPSDISEQLQPNVMGPAPAGHSLRGMSPRGVGAVVQPEAMSAGTAAPATRTTPELARTARDLPPGRREQFVWRWCQHPGLSLDSSMTDLLPEAPPCSWADRQVHDAPHHALLGTDGLHHLVTDGAISCCDDGEPATAAEPVELLAVPTRQRCPDRRYRWPAPLVGSSQVRVRRRLVETFGAGCAICTYPWAAFIDHDHFTGAVRGYLCRDCNPRVDQCIHLNETDCAYARYLVNPPAAPLGITYGAHARLTRQPSYLERRSLFDTVMNGGISQGHPALANSPLDVATRSRFSAIASPGADAWTIEVRSWHPQEDPIGVFQASDLAEAERRAADLVAATRPVPVHPSQITVQLADTPADSKRSRRPS
jgi:hypothetical protein